MQTGAFPDIYLAKKIRLNSDACHVNQWDLYSSISVYLHKMHMNVSCHYIYIYIYILYILYIQIICLSKVIFKCLVLLSKLCSFYGLGQNKMQCNYDCEINVPQSPYLSYVIHFNMFCPKNGIYLYGLCMNYLWLCKLKSLQFSCSSVYLEILLTI